MSAPPTVAVVVPFVSGTRYLLAAIRSVMAQSVEDWTLTVLDNAGPEPDAEHQVAALCDARVHYVRCDEHIPMADNWNRAISTVSAQWFVLLHADDEWEPTYLAEIRHLIDARPEAAACFTGGHTIGPEGARVFSLADTYKRLLLGRRSGDLLLRGEDGVRRLLRGNFVFASSVCMNRTAVGDAPFDTELRFAPDFELMLRLLFEGHELVASRADGCRYRRHEGQTTLALTRASSRFDEEVGVYRRAEAFCRRMGWRRAGRTARRRTSLRINLVVHAVAALPTDKREAVRLLGRAADLT